MLLAVGVLACGEKIDRELSPGGFIGAEVVTPRPMPNLVLTDAKGAPYNLAEQTLGTVTLEPGPHEIRVSAKAITGEELFRLRHLTLKPAEP